MSETSLVKSCGLRWSYCNIFFQSLHDLVVKIIFIVCASGSLGIYAESLPTPMSLDWGPSTCSLAGTAASLANNHDAFLTNPAGLFYYSGSSSFGGSWQSMTGDQSQWTAGLVDGTHDLIGGFQFAWGDIGSLTRRVYTVGSSYKTPYGIVGVSLHGYQFQGVPAGRGWHFSNSMGVLIPVGQLLSLGVYSKSPYDFQGAHDYLPPSVHLAIMYSKPGLIRASFESGRRFRVSNQDWYYAAAGDFLLQEYLAVRGGYRWEPRNEPSLWSLGLALIAPRIEIIGSFTRTTSGSQSNSFGVDTTFKF